MVLSMDNEDDLADGLSLAMEHLARLSEWERTFIQDLHEKYEKEGADMVFTPRQSAVLQRIVEKLTR